MNDTHEINRILNDAKQNCYTSQFESTQKFCDFLFDGLMCWPRTPAGVLAQQPCTNTYIKTTQQGFATKKCENSGLWAVPENFSKPWTNYSQCGGIFFKKTSNLWDHSIYAEWLPVIKSITQCGYIFSLVSLVIALIIFIKIKRLHCARNTLHIHLFVSFVLRAAMSLLKDALFVKGTALPHDITFIKGEPNFTKENYSWICKAIVSLRNYFITSNYMFLLMEGAYLHNLMFLNLFSEGGVKIYYILGWSIPLIFTIPWIVLKAHDENTLCWTQENSKYIALLLKGPIGMSVIINFLLFVIIIRVLFIKLNSMYLQQRKIKYRKLLRSTLILIPLFGIPYIITLILSFYVGKSQTLEILWLFWDQTFIAFQGLFASLVYCYLNSEVQMEIKRKYRTFKDRNNKEFKRSRTISHTQQIPLNEELQEYQINGEDLQDKMIVRKTDYF